MSACATRCHTAHWKSRHPPPSASPSAVNSPAAFGLQLLEDGASAVSAAVLAASQPVTWTKRFRQGQSSNIRLGVNIPEIDLGTAWACWALREKSDDGVPNIRSKMLLDISPYFWN